MSAPPPRPSPRASRLPEGVVLQPRRFEFRELESIPRHWFAGNPILTHVENAFSLMIPPGERFFIRSVRAYADRAPDDELARLIRAFVQQEAHHTGAHDEFNRALARHGVDVDRECAEADRAIARMERVLPKKMRLGATVFLEHLTATGAHVLFREDELSRSMHPEALRFWRWHAAEELEHKAVAFDLFRATGGGYLLRIASAVAAVALLAGPLVRMARRMLKDDPTPITREMREQARALNRKVSRPQLRMLADYFKPGFHPWKCHDEVFLADWYRAPETT